MKLLDPEALSLSGSRHIQALDSGDYLNSKKIILSDRDLYVIPPLF